MENERNLKIIELLLDCEDYMSGDTLAGQLKISRRTLVKDIQSCNDSSENFGFVITSKRRYGYRIEIQDPKKFQEYLNHRKTIEQRSINMETDVDYRKRQLRSILVMQQEPASIESLSEKIHVTTNVIFSYLKTFRENSYFARFNMNLITVPKKGVWLEGDEFYKRFCMIHSAAKLEYSTLSISVVDDFTEYFESEDMEDIQRNLNDILFQNNVFLSDYHNAWLVYYIILARYRINRNNIAQIQYDLRYISELLEYRVAEEVSSRYLADAAGNTLPGETLALAILFLLFNEKVCTYDELKIYGPFYEEAKNFCRNINMALKNEFNIDLFQTEGVKTVMLNCIMRLVFYFEFHLEKIAVQPIGLRGYYPRLIQDPVICELARYAQQVIVNCNDKPVRSFVTTLLAQMFETIMTLIPAGEPLNLALLMGEGKIYGAGIRSYLIDNFPFLFKQIEYIHYFHSAERNMEQYDAVLTTTSPKILKDLQKPVYKIPFFMEENIEYLCGIIPDLVYLKYIKAFKKLQIDLCARYYCGYKFTGKQALLNQIFSSVTDSWDMCQQRIKIFKKKDKIKKYNPANGVLFIYDMEAQAKGKAVFISFDDEYKWYEHLVRYVVYFSFDPAGNILNLKFFHLFCNELMRKPERIDYMIEQGNPKFDPVEWYEEINSQKNNF